MAKFAFTNLTNLLLSLVTFSNIIYNKQENYDRLTARTRWNTYYDYVIVGGGTAGSVLAARLSEDDSITVLLLEAGGSETVTSNTPGLQDALLGSLMDWKFVTVPQNDSCQAMNDKRCLLPAGRVIGGTSSINRMYYLRGNPADYDSWKDKYGLKSWGWKDTFPYIIRNENQTDPERAKTGYFGVSGPIPLEKSSEYNHLFESFLFTSKLSGYRMADLNTGITHGSSVLQTTTRNGKRISAASAFLEPHLKRRNLHILSNSFVYKILFDQKQAIGVRFYRNWKSYTVYAKQEILISAGTINSAKLLLLSGIGPKDELNKHKIPVIANLPVGENFHDHVGTLGLHFTIDLPPDSTSTKTLSKQTLKQYFQTGKGPLADARVAATMFKSSSYISGDHLDSSRQEAQESPDLMLLTYLNGLGHNEMTAEQATQRTNIRQEMWNRYYGPQQSRTHFTILPMILKPKSRGTVRLKSANVFDAPVIDPKYFSHSEDMDKLIEAMRKALQLAQSRPFRSFNTELFRSVVPQCESNAPFQVQDASILSPTSNLESNDNPFDTSSPPSWTTSLNTIPIPTQSTISHNLSTTTKFVASFLTKILFDNSKKANINGNSNGNSSNIFASLFGLRRRKQRSRQFDSIIGNESINYEHYWLHDYSKLSHYNKSNMIDGFSSMLIINNEQMPIEETNDVEEFKTVWNSHKFNKRNHTFEQNQNFTSPNTLTSTLTTTTSIPITITTKRPINNSRKQVTTTKEPLNSPTLPMKQPIRYFQEGSNPTLNTISHQTTPSLIPSKVSQLSERYLRCIARQMTAPIGDYVGTCRMGADGDDRRVVDSRFKVVGDIQGLRVIDASVIPEIVTGGIGSVAMMIGERGAEFVKEDLRRNNIQKRRQV